MIEILQQAIKMAPGEKYALGEQLVCDPEYADAPPESCSFAIHELGPGKIQLTCLAHGSRILAVEKALGTSHEGSMQRMLADHESKRAETSSS